ncbi:MAG: TVP38/TMEM64 family protein [bacterium]
MDSRAQTRRFALLLGFIAVTAVGAFLVLRNATLTPDAVRETVLAWGALAPLAYVAVVSMRPFIFFPSTLLFIAAGLAFGPWLGTLYAVIGGVIAAVITFLLARALGREFVQARLPARLQRLQEGEWGAGLIFVLNLVPIVPITAVNYGAGLSRVPLSHYTLAVLGGLTPRAFAYSFFGDALLDVGSTQFIVAVAVLALLVLVPALFRKRWFARWQG